MRLHFLSALIGEAFDYLHHILTGTLLECPLVLMPLTRDVKLTLDKAQAMRGCLERCRRTGGAVLVTPEHRQSLYLKGLELIKVAPEVSDDINRLPLRRSWRQIARCGKYCVRFKSVRRRFCFLDLVCRGQ